MQSEYGNNLPSYLGKFGTFDSFYHFFSTIPIFKHFKIFNIHRDLFYFYFFLLVTSLIYYIYYFSLLVKTHFSFLNWINNSYLKSEDISQTYRIHVRAKADNTWSDVVIAVKTTPSLCNSAPFQNNNLLKLKSAESGFLHSK